MNESLRINLTKHATSSIADQATGVDASTMVRDGVSVALQSGGSTIEGDEDDSQAVESLKHAVQ